MTEEKKIEEPEEATELDSSFKDAGGNNWKVKLSVPLVDEFCAEERISFGSFTPSTLTQAQLLTLAHRGTRWMTLAKEHPMTRKEFLERLCDEEGNPTEAYSAAMYAAVQAVGNFILRATVPQEQMRNAVNIARTEQESMIQAALGAAAKS